MLIHALCDYYDILEKSEKILPEGYSNVKIHYLVNLNKKWRNSRYHQLPRENREKNRKGKNKRKLDSKEYHNASKDRKTRYRR